MHAPRQGLFAALLALSFAAHALLMIQGPAHHLAQMRQARGELINRQLAAELTMPFIQRDTVALALLANRYGTQPEVANLQIVDANGQVLASSGQTITYDGEHFEHAIQADQQHTGLLKLTLLAPGRGDIIRGLWWPLLLSLLIHLFLWLFYRILARPQRSALLQTEHLEPQNQTPHHDQNASPTFRQAPSLTDEPNTMSASNLGPVTPALNADLPAYPLHLCLIFADARRLLPALSPSFAAPYFALYQTLLERALSYFTPPNPHIKTHILKRFDADGMQLGFEGGSDTERSAYAIQLAVLLNAVFDAVHGQQQARQQFSLLTQISIAAPLHGKSAQHWAEKLLQQVTPSSVFIHVSEPVLTALLKQYPMHSLPHPVDTQSREAMQVMGLTATYAQAVIQARARILAGHS